MACNKERQLQSLLFVEPGVAVSRVVQAQVVLIKTLTTAKALSDSVSGQLEVHTAEERAKLLVNLQS